MVTAVTPANVGPHLYERMPQTIEISRAVGTMWKTMDVRRKEMPWCVAAGQHQWVPLDCARAHLGTAINRSCQASGLPAQMPPQVQPQEVGKDILGHSANGSLRHRCKDGISQLREEGRPNASSTVPQDGRSRNIPSETRVAKVQRLGQALC